ncbi:MAG: MOSC N-terminal beta barrel domain-containing protein [Haloarculaceae archaeon]
MAAIERLRVYPVKGLDGVDRDAARIREGGTLEFDREFALFDAADRIVNGKWTDRVHELRTDFDTDTGRLRVETPAGSTRTFALDSEAGRERAAAWFSDDFGGDLTLERDTTVGHVDRTDMGPSVVSTATLAEVASWFEGLTVDSARRRLRANVEVSGVPAFWEDRFVGPGAPTFEAGDVRVEGVTPCSRCVVPSRDPDTGEPLEGFRERFVEKRRETFPAFADPDALDHYYSLMLIARVVDGRGGTLRVGDTIEVIEG